MMSEEETETPHGVTNASDAGDINSQPGDAPTSPLEKRKLTRRQMLALLGAGAASAFAGTVAYTMLVEPFWISVHRRPMPIAGLPAGLVGKTMLQISDLHVGDRVNGNYLKRAMREAAKLEPDLVVVTGDLSEKGCPTKHHALVQLLRDLPRAPLGCFGILGNHDYGRNWSEEDLADQIATQCNDHGLRVLRNESVTVGGGLQLIGMDDYWSPRYDAATALSGYRAGAPAVVLCHNPDVCDESVWGDFRGWILSGHTHGGQCKPPFLPPPLLPVKNRRYTAGHFEVGPGRDLYINPGIGYLIPARFNVRPEITLFTLEAA